MQEDLNKEDWQDWLEMQQTREFFRAIAEAKDVTLRMIVAQVDMDSLKQARFIGLMSGLQKVLDFEYDDGKPQ